MSTEPKVGTIQIPGELAADLAAAAKERAVGRNLLATIIIEHWLNNAPDPAAMLRAVAPEQLSAELVSCGRTACPHAVEVPNEQ